MGAAGASFGGAAAFHPPQRRRRLLIIVEVATPSQLITEKQVSVGWEPSQAPMPRRGGPGLDTSQGSDGRKAAHLMNEFANDCMAHESLIIENISLFKV